MPMAFTDALPVLKKITAAGFDAYFVGGCVRDYLLDRDINDVDIATSATPLEVKDLFSHTVDVGIEHGTIMVLRNGKGFEVTTFRHESSYSDFRRPDEVQFVRHLEDDLKRRDFTINAMAMDSDYKLTDLFGGQHDLKKRLIRTVGKAEERFYEDALRMLRGARFASQLSFELEDSTLQAMKKCSSLLQHVAIERKRIEMDKLLTGINWLRGISYLSQTGISEQLPRFSVTDQQINRMKAINLDALTIQQRWAAIILLMEISNSLAFLKQWRHSAKRMQQVEQLIKLYWERTKSMWNPVMLYETGIQSAIEAEKLYAAICHVPDNEQLLLDMWDLLVIKNRSELQVNGNDLLQWSNRQGGPWVGELLTEIEQMIITGQLDNNSTEIKKWVNRWSQK
ncbi:CCA tRNA nucleotidyltransferase [Jeotgalibacillus sp. S-D1]|uniref:CCA tRNA nucleotidyltransferase n=1 Tax=Jeotgalibacillus sp. S-D1 TaxID=2552189 RepID=UPI00105A50BC|nr:CCA tRNA nucleotidyltransferase [Jeotgalibacillus sp. S-D1]TDL34754.1 CCA tRNA nucleotidyltransferase [Jeotgalibacillus sp. S-D1]